MLPKELLDQLEKVKSEGQSSPMMDSSVSQPLSNEDIEDEAKAGEMAKNRVDLLGFGPSGYSREIETEKAEFLKKLKAEREAARTPQQIPKQLQDVLGQNKYASELPSASVSQAPSSKKDSEIEGLVNKLKANAEEEGDEYQEPIAPRAPARAISSKKPEEPASDLEKQLAEASKRDLEERTKYSDLLKDALQKRDFSQLAAQLGKASAQIGAGIGGTVERGTVTKPVGMDIYDKMMDIANQPISDLEKKKAYETEEKKSDPTSSESMAARAMMKELGIKVPETATAAFLEKQFPTISSLMARREATEQRREAAKERAQEMGLRRQELALKASQIQDEKTRNEFVKLQESTDPTKARSGAFGKQYDIVNQGDKLKKLVTRASSGFDLTSQELEEVAAAQAAILGGAGGKSRSQVQALVPHSLTGEVKKAWQWLSNRPTGTDQQEFVKRMYDTIEREQELARSELKKTIDKRIAVRRHLKERNPQLFQEVVNDAYSSLGITGGEKGAVVKDPQVQKYADEHFGGNYNDAFDFLEKRRKR